MSAERNYQKRKKYPYYSYIIYGKADFGREGHGRKCLSVRQTCKLIRIRFGGEMQEEKKPRYFEEALSDFTHDVASGRAIRHLVDLGYTTAQIKERLTYPTPRGRVEQTVYRYMKESGVIRTELPRAQEEMRRIVVKDRTIAGLFRVLRAKTEQNGEENSYISCPFGTIYRDREERMRRLLAPLTTREREYILGIPWEMQVVYHRLTSRMMEIGVQLAVNSEMEFHFFLLKSNEIVTLCLI